MEGEIDMHQVLSISVLLAQNDEYCKVIVVIVGHVQHSLWQTDQTRWLVECIVEFGDAEKGRTVAGYYRAFRGFISFGTSYGTAAFMGDMGYDGAFGIFGALTTALGLLAVPVYFWGKRIRLFTGMFAKSKAD